KDLAAIEWDLPRHCTIASVAGEDVRTWKQNDSYLLVWLNRTTTTTRIHLSGWLTLDHRDGHPFLELNGPRLQRTVKQHTRLHVAGSGEIALTSIRTRNLQPVKSRLLANGQRQPPSESDQLVGPDQTTTFETWDSSYVLECQVQSAANAFARVLTLAEV